MTTVPRSLDRAAARGRTLACCSMLALGAAAAAAASPPIVRLPALDADRVSVLVRVEVGSRDEADGEAGCAHYLEHCLFLSTTRRDRQAIHSQLRRRSIDFNAVTSRESTTYFFEADLEHAGFLAELAGELLTSPALLEEEVEAERGVVIDELGTLDPHVARHPIAEALYGLHPLSRDVGGSARTLGDLDAGDLRSFHERHYGHARMLVAWSGELEGADFEARLRVAFDGLPEGLALPPRRAPEAGVGRILLADANLGSRGPGIIVVGYHAEPRTESALAHLLVLEELLEDELEHALRVERAVAYHGRASLVTLSDAWRLEAVIPITDGSKAEEALAAARLAFERIAQPSAEDFAVAKEHALSGLEADSAWQQVRMLGLAALSGEGSPAALRDRIAMLETGDLRRLAPSLLSEGRSYLVTDRRSLLPAPLAAKVALALVLLVVALVVLRRPVRRLALAIRYRLRGGRLDRAELAALDRELSNLMEWSPRDDRRDD